MTWSEKQNVKWKVEIPGKGHSSPIVWNDRVFVTTAIPADDNVSSATADTVQGQPMVPSTAVQRFALLCLDRGSGALLWQRILNEVIPREGTHAFSSWASNSPVTDGERVYAFFGSRGLYCVDWQGDVQWERQIGEQRTLFGFGEASSPLLAGSSIIVNWDHEDSSFVMALDKRTGEEQWRTHRDEATSWSTPLTAEVDGAVQVITSARSGLRAYDLGSGELVWRMSGFRGSTTATAIVDGGLVYVTSSYEDRAVFAVKLEGAKGDIADSEQLAWKVKLSTPWVASPLLHGERLYVVKDDKGLFYSLDAATGRQLNTLQRLPGITGIYSSPVAAGDRVYFVGRNGASAVVRADDFETLAENQLDDDFSASPAIAGDELFLRGHRYLYCVKEKH